MINQYGFSRLEITRQNTIGQWILQLLLNGPLQWPGAVNRIEPGGDKMIHKGRTQFQRQFPVSQTLFERLKLDSSDAANLLHCQGMKYH